MLTMKALIALLRNAAAAVAIIALAMSVARADNNNPGGTARRFVAGEMLVTVGAGTDRAQVDAAAATVNAVVVDRFPAIDSARSIDAYQLRISGGATDDATTAAIATLSKSGLFRFVGYNKIKHFNAATSASDTPTDPLYTRQWDKEFMHCPIAWGIEKGEENVVAVVIDTGVDTSHPEFAGRLLPGYNAVTQAADGNPILTYPESLHGTHVAGIIAAQGGNGVGLCGVAWQKVKILPINCQSSSGGVDGAGEIRAFTYVDQQINNNRGNRYVINMSFGAAAPSDTPDLNDPENIAILKLANDGAVICISAGNNYLGDEDPANKNSPSSPANLAGSHANIMCIASSNKAGGHSVYSQSRPYTTIAAPGGQMNSEADPAGILSTLPLQLTGAEVIQTGYGYLQGTSMASPNAAGAAAILLSLSNVAPGDVKRILTTTAQPGQGSNNPAYDFGAGIVDLGAAVLQAAVSVTILSPEGTGGKANQTSSGAGPQPVETLTPVIAIAVRQVTPDKLTVDLDGTTLPVSMANIPASSITATEKDASDNDIPTSYTVEITGIKLTTGTHKLTVTGVHNSATDVTATDTRTFNVRPHEVAGGRALIAVPYLQTTGMGVSVSPETYFGTDFLLSRWNPATRSYAFYRYPDHTDSLASFTPPNVIPHLDGTTTSVAPLGLGYWVDTAVSTPVVTQGRSYTDSSIVIPLVPVQSGSTISWNMVGDPFPFDVPFNSILVETPEGRITVNEAASRGYILPTIYTYESGSGYTFKSLPDGNFKAWNGHWIGVTTNRSLSLVVPPDSVSRSVRSASAPTAGKGGWAVQLSASSGNLRDTFNFIGVGSNRGFVQKPPMPSPYVTLGIQSDTDSLLGAQDFRAASTKQSWKVVVDTDQPNKDVTVSWNGAAAIGRSTKLMLKDDVTGQTIDMRNRSSYTFNSGNDAGKRSLTITSAPSTGSYVRVSNVSLQTTRGTGTAISFSLSSDATYEVRILKSTGATVATVGSRAAAAGDVHVMWTGRDASGRAVPIGTYLVQIRALGNDGDVAKVVQPLVVVR